MSCHWYASVFWCFLVQISSIFGELCSEIGHHTVDQKMAESATFPKQGSKAWEQWNVNAHCQLSCCSRSCTLFKCVCSFHCCTCSFKDLCQDLQAYVQLPFKYPQCWHRPSFSTRYQRTHHASNQMVFVYGVGWDISCPRCQVFSRTPGWHTTRQSQQISSAYISLSLQHIQKVLQCESALGRRDYSQALKRCQHFYLCLWAISFNVQLSAEFSHFLSKEHVNGMTLLSK